METVSPENRKLYALTLKIKETVQTRYNTTKVVPEALLINPKDYTTFINYIEKNTSIKFDKKKPKFLGLQLFRTQDLEPGKIIVL